MNILGDFQNEKKMIFGAYFVSAFVTYVLLFPLYAVELQKVRDWQAIVLLMKSKRGVELACLLGAVKGADWALYMSVDEHVGALFAAVVCPIILFGFQEWVDQMLRGQPSTLSGGLWRRSFLSVGTIADGWIHLSLFRFLRYYAYAPLWVGVCNVVAHSVGLFSTYPFTSVRRNKQRWWEGFALYYVRSSAASFFISLFAEMLVQ